MKKEFEIISLKDNIMNIDPFPGSNFSQVVSQSMKQVEENENLIVKFKFNNVSVSIDKNSSIETASQFYMSELDRMNKEYQSSPAGIAAQEKRESERKANLEFGTSLVNDFDNAVKNKSSLIKWIGQFALLNDCTHIDCDRKALAQKMKDNGFERPFLEDSKFNALDEKTKLEFGILSNAFKEFSEGKNVHPVAHSFSQKYAVLEEKENAISNLSSIREKLTTSINNSPKPN